MKELGLNSLPREIKLDISSRLPVESVLDCRLICRSWRDILQFHDSTYFANLHLRQQLIQQQDGDSHSSVMNFALMNFEKPRVLYCVKYHDKGENINDRQPNLLTRKVNFKFPTDVVGFVGSSNGLICLSVMKSYTDHRHHGYGGVSCRYFEEPLYICNPITREFLILPKACIDQQEIANTVRIVYGFGFHPVTDEYKVVRIRYVRDKPQFKGLVEVYTLGNGSGWQSKGETNYYVWPNSIYDSNEDARCAVGVCVGGALHWHWLHKVSTEILVFDLAKEEFHLLPTPHSNRLRRACDIGGCLSLVCSDGFQGYDIWFLKKNMEENGSSTNRNEQCYKCPSWIRGFSLPYNPSRCWIYELFALTTRNEVLYISGLNGHIYCDNLEKKTSKKIWMPPKDNGRSWVLPVPHINSFVSLKALGESHVSVFVEARSKDDRLVSQGPRWSKWEI